MNFYHGLSLLSVLTSSDFLSRVCVFYHAGAFLHEIVFTRSQFFSGVLYFCNAGNVHVLFWRAALVHLLFTFCSARCCENVHLLFRVFHVKHTHSRFELVHVLFHPVAICGNYATPTTTARNRFTRRRGMRLTASCAKSRASSIVSARTCPKAEPHAPQGVS